MAPTRTAVHILMPDFVAVLQQGKKLEELEHLNQMRQQMLDQLVWWTKALKVARDNEAQLEEIKAA